MITAEASGDVFSWPLASGAMSRITVEASGDTHSCPWLSGIVAKESNVLYYSRGVG